MMLADLVCGLYAW